MRQEEKKAILVLLDRNRLSDDTATKRVMEISVVVFALNNYSLDRAVSEPKNANYFIAPVPTLI